jgi:hypothetical protein
MLYSKNSLRVELSDRLIYILVPIESVLLASESEPITQNISERIALLVGNSLEERKAIRRNVKAIYETRSRFIHHGKAVTTEKLDEIKAFMFTALRFFLILAQNANHFSEKAAAIQNIDDMKFTGGLT